MKKQLFYLIVASAFVACGDKKNADNGEKDAAKAEESASTYTVDKSASSVSWIGKKVTGQHNGTVDIKSGELKVDKGAIQAGRFVMDMTSIKDLDLTDTAYNGKLTRHLHSDDFFATAKHPESVFEITSVKEKKENDYTHEVSGNLTIKGITKNISFPATVQVSDNEVNAKGTLVFDRTEYDIRYNSGKFFPGLADKAINDEVELQIKLVAKK